MYRIVVIDFIWKEVDWHGSPKRNPVRACEKMKADWKSILKNEKLLLTHTRSVNFVNRVRGSMHALANLHDSSEGHRENSVGV